jgi:hypothetical protein
MDSLDPRLLPIKEDSRKTPIKSLSAVPRSYQERLRKKPTAYVNIFVVANFCGEGQNSQMNPLKNQCRTLFHNIDKEFQPNNKHDNASHKELISISKLEKADAVLHDLKCFLGWDFQGSNKELLMAIYWR